MELICMAGILVYAVLYDIVSLCQRKFEILP